MAPRSWRAELQFEPFCPGSLLPAPDRRLISSRNDANVGSQKYFKSKVNTTFIPVFKLKDTQQKDASIQTSSVVTSLSKTNLSTPTSDQSSNAPTKRGLSGLLLDLSQISPSLNKYKGVLGRQSHLHQGKGKPKHMAEVNASDNSFFFFFLSHRLRSSKTRHENGYGWNFKSLAPVFTQEAELSHPS